jgi:hypothetical protein
VHPGIIDLRDELETATELFRLVNMIADRMIHAGKASEVDASGTPRRQTQGHRGSGQAKVVVLRKL